MFQHLVISLLFDAPARPDAVAYLEAQGFHHVVVAEGTQFTGYRPPRERKLWEPIEPSGWCEGTVTSAGHNVWCSPSVVPLCDGFQPVSCANRVLKLEKSDVPQALAILQRGCANGDDNLCLGLTDQPFEVMRSQLPMHWMGCGRGEARACGNLAVFARRVGHPEVEAFFFDLACTRGNEEACRALDEAVADEAAARIAAR